MLIEAILTPACTRLETSFESKERLLKYSAHLIAENVPSLTEEAIFNALVDRERLGSTAMGYGVAIPHGHLDGLQKPIGAFLRLSEGIDFEAKDHQKVDLIFVLLVPADEDDTHIQILAALAGLFIEPDFRERLRQGHTQETLFKIMTETR